MVLLSWKEIKERNLEGVFTLLCGSLFASGLIFPKLEPLLMALSIIVFLVSKQAKNWSLLWNWKKPWLWMLVLYLAHGIGAFYSSNKGFLSFDLGFKIALLFVPLLAVGFSEGKRLLFLRFLVFSALITCLFDLLHAAYSFQFLGHNVLLNENEFSLFLHRSYQGIYWLVAALFLFVPGVVRNAVLKYLFLLILVMGIFLTFSKAAIIGGVLIGLFIFIRLLRTNWKQGLLILLTMAALVFGIDKITLKPRARLLQMVETLISQEEGNETDSNSARIIMWGTAVKISIENPILGVGTGDIKDELQKRNMRDGHEELAKMNLNAHNQFLNFSVALGIMGLFPFLMIWLTSFVVAWKQNPIYSYVLLVLLFFNFTESSFESEAGFIFQLLLLSLINIVPNTHAKNIHSHTLS